MLCFDEARRELIQIYLIIEGEMEKTLESLDAEIIEQLGEGESWGVLSVHSLICLCFLIGSVKLFNFLATIFSSFFRRRLNLKERYGGGWALVTGGSEGIG